MFNITYEMRNDKIFNINKKCSESKVETHLEIFFEYRKDINIIFSILLSSFSTDFTKYNWSELIDKKDTNYRFVSQCRNQGKDAFINIENTGNDIKFRIYNAIGKDIELSIPIELCKDKFYNFNNIFEKNILSVI
jgi:hypothetical protein